MLASGRGEYCRTRPMHRVFTVDGEPAGSLENQVDLVGFGVDMGSLRLPDFKTVHIQKKAGGLEYGVLFELLRGEVLEGRQVFYIHRGTARAVRCCRKERILI